MPVFDEGDITKDGYLGHETDHYHGEHNVDSAKDSFRHEYTLQIQTPRKAQARQVGVSFSHIDFVVGDKTILKNVNGFANKAH